MELWQRQLIRNHFPYSASKLSIEAGFVAKFPHIPQKLYKYRCFSKYHKEALERDQLWFSSPNNFNDPFDTAIYFNPDCFLVENLSIEQVQEKIKEFETLSNKTPVWEPKKVKNPIRSDAWLENMMRPVLSNMSGHDQSEIKSVIKELKGKVNEEIVNRMMADLRSGYSVLSLSANPTSNLMWSHYSESHKGFCIEYDFGILPYSHIRKRMCFPVLYRKKRTDATRYLRRMGEDFNNLFAGYLCLLKSYDWEYEKEWRIMHPIGSPHANEPLWMPVPHAIILGMDASPEDAEWLTIFCNSRGIVLKQAKRKFGTLEISIVE